MLTLIEKDGRKFVYLSELYSKLELDRTNYPKFIREQIQENEYAQKEKDFSYLGTKSTGGRPKADYLLSHDFAKDIILRSKSKVGKKFRDWLISLGNEVENGLRPTHSEILFLMDLVKLFAYHEYRERARSLHRDAYVHNLSGGKQTSGWMYGRFEKWRADALGLGKEDLETKIKEYCIANYARVPKRITQAEALIIIDKYELIKNAVWDLLMSKNKSEQYIKNICALAKELAERLEPEFKRWNQQTLFGEKEKTVEFRVLQAIQ